MTGQYQTEVLFRNYIKQVERSGILNDAQSIPPTKASDLSAVLASSSRLARTEFARVHPEMVALFSQIQQIERSIKSDIDAIRERYPAQQKTWHEVFEEFERGLGAIFAYAQRTLIGSFDKKVKRMDNFTVCVFGKTKAGKSTTMEALTCGNGETIGKGRQNTTLEAKEYYWHGLSVVDTPGIDSMQERKELETTALSYADASDLILFLMPHTIVEADFLAFARFYRQHKPIVILLNIKKDTHKPGTPEFDEFMQFDSQEVFGSDHITGYYNRIRGFILKTLGIAQELVPVVPVHSLSAYQARTPALSLSEQIRKGLYDFSRFHALEERLTEEVKSYGELYRIRNPYDTLILFSREIGDHFRSFNDLMQKQKSAFEGNVKRFSDVAAAIRRQHGQTVQKSFDQYFAGKRASAKGVVDDLFEAEKTKNDLQKILQDFMPEQQLRQKVDEAQAEIRVHIEKEVTDFFRSFQHQLEEIAVEAEKAKVGQIAGADIADASGMGGTANLLQGLSVASGVVSSLVFATVATTFLGPVGTIFWIGTANIWNPVGWGLMGLGIILSIFGWAKSKQMREKLRKAKADAETNLIQAVNQTEHSIKEGLGKWVEDTLTKIQTDHIDVMAQYAQYAGKHLAEISAVTGFLDKLNSRMRKIKYQSMIRRFESNDTLAVDDVTENHDKVAVTLSGNVKHLQKLEKALSRVEERSVAVHGAPPCHT